jgi:hypothetical protein
MVHNPFIHYFTYLIIFVKRSLRRSFYKIATMKSNVLVLFLLLSSLASVHAQTDTITKTRQKITRTIIAHEIMPTDTVSKYNDAVYTLVGDTLFINKDFKIFIGQKLIVGNGSSRNGWYKTISDNSFLDWYSLTLAVLGTEETEDEKELRVKDITRDCLHAEGTLNVSKIKKSGNTRHGFLYIVYFRSKSGEHKYNYRCYIQEALKTGEIVLPNE